jgi:hypothetical protein
MKSCLPRLVVCVLLGTVLGHPVAASDRAVLYPGVARIGGVNQTSWRSGAAFHNPTAGALTVRLDLLPRDSASVAATAMLDLAVGETRQVEDLYAFLHAADGAGMLRVSGDAVAWLRTYNQGATGTFGQDLAGVQPDAGFRADEVVVFPFSKPGDPKLEFRSNLLLVNLETVPITLTLRAGSLEKTKTIPAGTYAQVDNVGSFLGAPGGFGVVRVRATGRWSGTMSTVDPFTGDPTTVRGLLLSETGARLYAGVAKVGGANQTAWRSEAILHNPGDAAAQVTLELIPRDGSAVAAHTALTLQAGETRRLVDLYQTLGVASGAGALRVSPGALIWARTYNQGAQGSFGQDLPPVVLETATGGGIPVALPFAATANIALDFRSNLIVQNLESHDVTLSVRTGSTLKMRVVKANAYSQIDNLGSFLGVAPGAYTAWVLADGRWAGAISTIDPVTGDPTTMRADGAFTPPSSYDLIEEAAANQTISAEQALTYKVFSDFGDTRVPAALRGDDRLLSEGDATAAAAASFATLTPATQELVGPFLVQPFVAGSWWDRRRSGSQGISAAAVTCRPWATTCPLLTGDWAHFDGTHVRIWYLVANATTDRPMAVDLASAADTTIWTGLTTAMGRTPKPDGDEGGNALYDVILTDGLSSTIDGNTLSTALFACKDTPAFTSLNRGISDPDKRKSVLAHEMMHGVQYGTPSSSCVESMKWLMESTATWFEDLVYPKVNREHDFAAAYLDTPNLSFDNAPTPRRTYGAYVFFFYLTRVRGVSPAVIGQIWNATKTADGLHALDTALRGAGAELDKSWPDFAAYAWNDAAPFDTFKTLDTLTDQARVLGPRSVSLAVPSTYNEVQGKSDLNLPRLSIRYYQYEFPDLTASSVAFFNGLTRSLDFKTIADYGDVFTATSLTGPDTAKGGHITALLKIGGKWTKEDWTSSPGRTFCRDLKAERLESLVVILSNADIGETSSVYPRGRFGPLMYASNVGCGAWEASANLTLKWGSSATETMNVTGLRLEPFTDGYWDPDTPVFRAFTTVAGGFGWSASGSDQSCSYSGAFSGQLTSPMNAFQLLPWVVKGVGYRGIVSDMFWEWLQLQKVLHEACPGSSVTTYWHGGEFVLAAIPESAWARLSQDGKTLSIDAAKTPAGPELSGTWTFHSKPE